jgi:hypothetical protein|eukprot:COSAG06_NODE_1632_length_8855_cov_44.798310_6_plen_168_part_00
MADRVYASGEDSDTDSLSSIKKRLRRGAGGNGEVIPIYISTFVSSIHNINCAANCFDADFTVALAWHDKKLTRLGEEVDPGTYLTISPGGGKCEALDENIRPDVFLINDIDADMQGETALPYSHDTFMVPFCVEKSEWAHVRSPSDPAVLAASDAGVCLGWHLTCSR